MIETHISFLLISQYLCNQMLQSHLTKLQFRHVVLLKSHELSHFLTFWLLFEAATLICQKKLESKYSLIVASLYHLSLQAAFQIIFKIFL